MKSLFLLIGMGWALSFGSWTWAEPEVPKPEVKKPQMTAEEEVALGKFRVAMSEAKKGLQEDLKKEDLYYRIPMKVTARLMGVSAKGVPKDLAEAFAAYRSIYRKQVEHLMEMPKDDEKARQWVNQKFLDGTKFSDDNCELENAEEQSAQSLIRVASAYGLEKEVDLFDAGQLEVARLIQTRWVVILGASGEFPKAKALAETLSAKLGMPFTMSDRVFDEKGLHYPGDYENEALAGGYEARRDNEELNTPYLTVEYSDGYRGFAQGLYLVVAKICETKNEAEKEMEAFKKVAPEAYTRRTRIYLGCLD